MAKTELFVRKQKGGMFSVVNEGMTTGDIYFVDSGKTTTGGDSAGYGKNPDKPFLTLDYALSQLTANQQDRIYVMSGHTETVASAADIACATAGVEIIGLGKGADRPTFTFSATASTWTISAASVTLENLLLVNGVDNLNNGLVISAADCTLKNIETRDNNASYHCDDFIAATSGATRLHINGWWHRAGGGKSGAISALALDGNDDMILEDFHVEGNFSVGCIDVSTGSDEILRASIKRGTLINTNNTPKPAIDADTACTGVIEDVYMRIYSGSSFVANDPDFTYVNTFGMNTASGGWERIGTAPANSITSDLETVRSDVIVMDAIVDTIASDLLIAASDIVVIQSDVKVVISDLTTTVSDMTIIVSDLTSLVSDLTIQVSDFTVLASDISSDLTAIETDTNNIYSDTTQITSDVIELASDIETIASDLVVLDAIVDTAASDIVVIMSDVKAVGSDLIVLDAIVDNINSDVDVIETNLNTHISAFSSFETIMSDFVVAWEAFETIMSDFVVKYESDNP